MAFPHQYRITFFYALSLLVQSEVYILTPNRKLVSRPSFSALNYPNVVHIQSAKEKQSRGHQKGLSRQNRNKHKFQILKHKQKNIDANSLSLRVCTLPRQRARQWEAGEPHQVQNLEQKAGGVFRTKGRGLTGWYFVVYLKGMSSKPKDSSQPISYWSVCVAS